VVDWTQLRESLAAEQAVLLDRRIKGFPLARAATPLGALGGLGLNVLREDLPFPVCVARSSAIETNRAWMRGFLDLAGVSLAPHAKTTMAPRLIEMQIHDGAWGFCVATAQQAAVLRSFGIRRIVIANQLVGQSNIDYILTELKFDPALEIYAIVDSAAGLERMLEAAHRQPGAGPLRLLVEVGAEGGRTGCRSVVGASELAEAVARAGPAVQLSGIEAYESVFPLLEPADRLARIEQLLGNVLEVATKCRDEGWFAPTPVILSAGGSEYYDRVALRLRGWWSPAGSVVVLRSGCYIAHDHLGYVRAFENFRARSPELCPTGDTLIGALEVWGVVQARPEPELALLTIGKRDVSFDLEMPVPLRWFRRGLHTVAQDVPSGHSIRRLNDQHAFLQCPVDSALQVGDLVGLGVSHPCTTFDRWSLIYLVDDGYTVRSAFRTFF
jgi:D-serine dehydratase